MFDLPKYGDGVCLARLAALLDAVAIDRAGLQRRCVVVTGSNGKGSTAAFCAGIGRAYGLRTGMFSSPHLFRFNERFQIDGASIDDETLARLVSKIEAAAGKISRTRSGEQFGAFEAQFALACLYFQERKCDFAVFEAGIGGRCDPVRLIGATSTCVTSVDLEHVDLLGHSFELIASDKSDACAAGGTIVYGESCRDLGSHLAEYNRFRGVANLFVREQVHIANETVSSAAQRFDLRFEQHHFQSLEISLPGLFQFNNAAVAVTLFLLWLQQSHPDAPQAAIEKAVRKGLGDTTWPGRLEVIGRDPLVVIDVGHTPDGIRQALTSVTAIHGADNWILVVGVSRDKKADEILGLLAPAFDTIICTGAHHKGTDAQDIAIAARHANPSAAIQVAATIEAAVALSLSLAQTSGRKIFAAGGLFLAIEYATIARGGRAQDLNFF